jgi:hypothetical protein
MRHNPFTLAILAVLLQACPAPTQPGATTPTHQRATSDRPDEVTGLQIHPVYVLPPGAADHALDTNGAIHDALLRVNAWFKTQTDGRTLRLDTAGGRADVSFHRLVKPLPESGDSAVVLQQVVAELQAAGLDHPQKVLLILLGQNLQTDWTGVGGNLKAMAQVVPAGIWPAPGPTFDGLDKVVAHELLHALGAVPDGAPNRHAGYHAGDDAHDVMTARSDRSAPWTLDVGRNDYYGHGRTELHDLARSFYWDPVPADAELWAGQPLTLSAGPNPTSLSLQAISSDPDLTAPAMAAVQQWRQQAGQPPLPEDDALRRLLSRHLDGRLGGTEASADELRFRSLYAGNFHVWRQRGRLAPGGDPAALMTTMVAAALANGGGSLVSTGLTGAGAVCRRQGDELWLALGVGTSAFQVQDITISDGPHGTRTLTGQVRRHPQGDRTVVQIGNDSDLGYSLPLQPDWRSFAVSVPRANTLTLRLRTWDGAAWIGSALCAVGPAGTLQAPSAQAIDKPMAAAAQF